MTDGLASANAARAPSAVLPLRANPHVRYCLGVIVLAATYFGAALAGNALRFTGNVDAVWPPVGVGIAFLYFGGLRFWPGLLMGDLLADLPGALPLGPSLGQTIGNMLEVVVATLLLRRLVRRGSPLDSVDGLWRMLVAIGIGTAISATVGSLSLRLGGVITTHEMPTLWRTWFLGDSCGALVIVPLALAWFRHGPTHLRSWRTRGFEGALLLAAVVGLTDVAFRSHIPLTYLVFPALIWGALRFGQQGGTLAVAVAVGVAIWQTAHRNGPFAVHSITVEALSTQLYVAVAALSTLVVAAIVTERERFGERLAASRARVIGAADGERRRLERNLHDGAQQRLTALAFQLREAGGRVQQAPEQAPILFHDAETELSLAIDELRDLAHGIHPAVLTDLGLEAAAENIAGRAQMPVTVDMELPRTRLDDGVEATAYYVIAESVANAQKHASASAIWIRASLAHGKLHLAIGDDGVGGATDRSGSGLEGLRDRVEASGGTFVVDSPPGRGTLITATIPTA